ncbi:MAG: hypothetical protein WED00_03650 [Aquisalimonadaceae bacterium]
MPIRAFYLFVVLSAGVSLSAGADSGSLRAQGDAALERGDCQAMIEARRRLAPAAEQHPQGEEAALRGRLADAILRLPDCGDSRFLLLRSRPLRGDALLGPGDGDRR